MPNTFNRVVLPMLWYFVLIVAVPYIGLRVLVCNHCNRLGNFLDSWYQVSMMVALSHHGGTASRKASSKQCGHITTHRGDAQHQRNLDRLARCEQAGWRRAIGALNSHLRGVGWGISLRRIVRREFQKGSLAAHAYSRVASHLPPKSFWHSPEGRLLLDNLRSADIHFHFWTDMHILRSLLPYLRPSLHELLRSFEVLGESEDAQGRGGSEGSSRESTCVVHYRAGDFLDEVGEEAEKSAAALASAAATMPRVPARFELLDGGVTQHLCLGQKCGDIRGALEKALRKVFRNATIVRISGTPDEDFVRMASAPMLVVGGGSYATFGALASNGEVRMPNCVLKFGEDGPCVPVGAALLHGLRTYAHPRCGCVCNEPHCLELQEEVIEAATHM